MNSKAVHPRRLVVVLGDQLDIRSSAFDGFDNDRDAVWMAEVRGESEHVWSHKARIAVFLSAMRHFRDELLEHGLKVHYSELGERGVRSDLKGELERSIRAIRPRELVVVEPGEWRVERDLRSAAVALGVHLDVRTDKHFLCSREEFADHAEGRRNLIMEPFYRWMRKRTGYLLKDGKPEGERWNLDSMNRRTFGREGPGKVRSPRQFRPDETTTQVLSLVEREFPDHPGSLAGFDWPVTRRQARAALRDFIRHRLSGFGEFEDAMWTGEPFLFHSRLSCAMNLKLLDPRAAAEAAIAAWEEGAAPLNSVEGFVRQVIGWREYV
ncbi:MAG TPA: cryptochrome/photolyase family protein, partial [bacterium]|nr:cryptochrome/photolyase family protein [bacterium]